jgi:hypothetical protein
MAALAFVGYALFSALVFVKLVEGFDCFASYAMALLLLHTNLSYTQLT